jgi:hypothetical protein
VSDVSKIRTLSEMLEQSHQKQVIKSIKGKSSMGFSDPKYNNACGYATIGTNSSNERERVR